MKIITNSEKYSIDLVATPIGNLGDVTSRSLQVLEASEIVLAEDTRNAKNLFQKLNISFSNRQFISFHNFNENDSVNKVLELIKENKKVILMSDAGYPTISDPGWPLIKKCIELNIKVNVYSGPSPIMHSLIVSGLSNKPFTFFGFLSNKKTKIASDLKKISLVKTTLIIYESVHRIKEVLKVIGEIFLDKEIVVARELTKMHETIYFGKASELISKIEERGEFVILIDNNNQNKNLDIDDAIKIVNERSNENKKLKDVCKEVALEYNLSSNELYKKILKEKNNE